MGLSQPPTHSFCTQCAVLLPKSGGVRDGKREGGAPAPLGHPRGRETGALAQALRTPGWKPPLGPGGHTVCGLSLCGGGGVWPPRGGRPGLRGHAHAGVVLTRGRQHLPYK